MSQFSPKVVAEDYDDLKNDLMYSQVIEVALNFFFLSAVSGSLGCIRDPQSVHLATASPKFVFSLSVSGL